MKKISIFLCLVIALSFAAFSAENTGSSTGVSRIECLKNILQSNGVTDENALAAANTCWYDGNAPMNDIPHMPPVCRGYVIIAYFEKIAYGKYIPESHEKSYDELVKPWNKFPERTYHNRKIYMYDANKNILYNLNGDVIPIKTVVSGYNFCPDDNVTAAECVAFMVRSLKKDESLVDLDKALEYAKKISLILPEDSFYEAAYRDITVCEFENLLERWKNLTALIG